MEKHLHHAECIEGMKILQNESVDIILTDPPYKYLKNQKLEVDFDEKAFFKEVKRVLKKGGFIVLFGRGTSFYRWNYMLSELGFNFKEEIVWDKCNSSSPLLPLSRVHETVSIHSKGKSIINKIKIPYLEMKSHDLNSIVTDFKRLKTILNNTKSFDAVIEFLKTKSLNIHIERSNKHKVQVEEHIKNYDRSAAVASSMEGGMVEKSIIRYNDSEKKKKFNATIQPSKLASEDRSAAVVRIIDDGMNEKSIIKQQRDHYTSIHPTQKPVRLLERLLKLVLPQRSGCITIIDPFAGSFSTCEAVQNIALEFPENHFLFHGWEIDDQYYNDGCKRIGYIKNNFSTPLNF